MDNTAEILAATQPLIEQGWRNMAYRPTVSAVLTDKNGNVLLLDSGKWPNNISFLQGGIEEDEDAVTALRRELSEESGGVIVPDDVIVLKFLGFQDIDAETGRIDKRGFEKGKRYINLLAQVKKSPGTFTSKEVIASHWVKPSDVEGMIPHISEAKRELMMKVLLSSELI